MLDLGCGTGLGYDLVSQSLRQVNYIRSDSSEKMLEILESRLPNAHILHTPMSDLSEIESGSVDLVISLFTAFSYTDDPRKTVAEIYRVLKSGGRFFVSALSRFSLRRVFDRKFDGVESYRSRGTTSPDYSHAWVFSLRQLSEIFEVKGNEVKGGGYNAFTGFSLLSKPRLWGTSRLISWIFPNLSHEI